MRRATVTSICVVFIIAVCRAAAPPSGDGVVSSWNEQAQGPMPRWREGGTPPVDPALSLTPYSVRSGGGVADAPTSGMMASPPEYAPCRGVLFRYSTGAWPTVVRDCVVALTADPEHDEIAYVVVSNAGQQSAATSQFAAAGADMSKVEFLLMPNDSIWLRDYGPHYAWQSGVQVIADSHYYPGRPLDNFVPTLVAEDNERIPAYAMGLYYSGGNFQPGPNRTGFITSLVYQDNPGFDDRVIGDLYLQYQGIDDLHIFPRLPGSVDATGHIDMWFYIVDDDTVIISEFLPGSNATAISVTNDAAATMHDLGFEVFRVPDHNGFHPNDPACHYTYTNAFRVNDRIFIPSYGSGGSAHATRDAEALATWQAAAPDAEIVPIDCYGIIWAAGAIHCIVMQVPRYDDPAPAAHVIAPSGGERLVSGAAFDVRWAVSDDDPLYRVDLRYSLDGGATFPYVIATDAANNGRYAWTVPDVVSEGLVVQVVADDGDGHVTTAESTGPAEVMLAAQKTYDFAVNAGVDRWAWGWQTSSFSSVDGVRHPASASNELSATSYARLAASDADGSDADTDRYIAPTPASFQESTHVFEFTLAEDPAAILDLEVVWEGYGDACLQVEVYGWDNVQGDWCDGLDGFGENRYLDNFAGNRDRLLRGRLNDDVTRYVDGDNRLTLLAYAERPGQETFHDYLGLTVTYLYPGDADASGQVDVDDLVEVVVSWGPCPALPAPCGADIDGNGVVDVDDLVEVIVNWGAGG